MFVAIYNAWDHELLRQSVDNILKAVDKVIIVYSNTSNKGEKLRFPVEQFADCALIQHEPDLGLIPHKNEQNKRNAGLSFAQEIGANYFIMADCDEFYQPEDVRFWYEYLRHSSYSGLVCRSHVYFGKPTLTIGEDTTYVPFIHKVVPGLKFVFTQDYPYTKHEGKLRIDPTRRLNLKDNVKLIGCIMHHYSYVRKDIDQKINNSSAESLKKVADVIKNDLKNAEKGYFCQYYGKELMEAPNLFNL
jgi:hypothetical protein